MVDDAALGRNGRQFSTLPGMVDISVHGQEWWTIQYTARTIQRLAVMVDNSVHGQEWWTIQYMARDGGQFSTRP